MDSDNLSLSLTDFIKSIKLALDGVDPISNIKTLFSQHMKAPSVKILQTIESVSSSLLSNPDWCLSSEQKTELEQLKNDAKTKADELSPAIASRLSHLFQQAETCVHRQKAPRP